jgi:hypothetical protein
LPLLVPSTLPSTLFSKIFGLHTSLTVRDQVSHPYKAMDKIIMSCNLCIFGFLDRCWSARSFCGKWRLYIAKIWWDYMTHYITTKSQLKSNYHIAVTVEPVTFKLWENFDLLVYITILSMFMAVWLIITGFWIGWLDLLSPSCTITRNHNQSSAKPFFLDCRGLTPFSFSFRFDSVLYYLHSLKADQ